MQKFLNDAIDNLVNYLMVGGDLDRVSRMLTQSTAGLKGMMDPGTAGYQMYMVLMAGGTALVVFYFVLYLLNAMGDAHMLTFEMFMGALIRMLLSYLVLINALPLMTYGVEASNLLVERLSSVSGYSKEAFKPGLQCIKDYINNLDINDTTTMFWYGARVIVPFFVMWFTRVIIFTFVAVRAIQLLVKTMIAPFAVSNWYSENGVSSGMRFVRGYIGTVFQGVAIIAVIWAGTFVVHAEMESTDSLTKLSAEMRDVDVAQKDFVDKYGSKLQYAYDQYVSANVWKVQTDYLKNTIADVRGLLTKSGETGYSDYVKYGTGGMLLDEILGHENLMLICVIQMAVAQMCKKSGELITDAISPQ